ncbi:hypothetical protein ANO11243_088700 [Dothideomycetidae sp. 11243]|nr:hypothetical protein ANO11243_088700 [fungal sp. No.11243]
MARGSVFSRMRRVLNRRRSPGTVILPDDAADYARAGSTPEPSSQQVGLEAAGLTIIRDKDNVHSDVVPDASHILDLNIPDQTVSSVFDGFGQSAQMDSSSPVRQIIEGQSGPSTREQHESLNQITSSFFGAPDSGNLPEELEGQASPLANGHPPNTVQTFDVVEAVAAVRDPAISPALEGSGSRPRRGSIIPLDPLPPLTASVEDMPDLVGDAQMRQQRGSVEAISPMTTSFPPATFPTTTQANDEAPQHRASERQPSHEEPRRDSRLSTAFRKLSQVLTGRTRSQTESVNNPAAGRQRSEETNTRTDTRATYPTPVSAASSSVQGGSSNEPGRQETHSGLPSRDSQPPSQQSTRPTVRFADTPRSNDRDTDEHRRLTRQSIYVQDLEHLRTRSGRRRSLSIEATAALDDDEDPELAYEIEHNMLMSKRAEKLRRETHRRTPITTPVEDIVLSERQRKTAAKTGRKIVNDRRRRMQRHEQGTFRDRLRGYMGRRSRFAHIDSSNDEGGQNRSRPLGGGALTARPDTRPVLQRQRLRSSRSHMMSTVRTRARAARVAANAFLQAPDARPGNAVQRSGVVSMMPFRN